MYYHSTNSQTDRERYLEEELERERESQRERDRIEAERRESQRREREEMRRYEERQASSWPEAFRKQIVLCWREHNAYPEFNSEATGDPTDDYFKNMAQANEKALEIWREVEASKQKKIKELQRQIDAVQDEIRNETADQLESVSDKMEYRNTADSIRDDNPDAYLNW
jgi:5-methylthioribose kinase